MHHAGRDITKPERGQRCRLLSATKRDDINRVEVPTEQLKQWRCGAETLGAFVAQSLGLRSDNQRKTDAGLWELGLVTGKKRSQMVCLRAGEALELVAGRAMPSTLSELVRFGAKRLFRGLRSDPATGGCVSTTGDSRYTPWQCAAREARKLKTQALHESWQKEYRAQKKRRPEMSDVWSCAAELRSWDIKCKERSAETIRKHMTR